MSLTAAETLDVLQNASSFETGKSSVQVVNGLLEVYGDRSGADYTNCEEKRLRSGMIKIFKGLKSYFELPEGTNTDKDRPGAFHNDQMTTERLSNAIAELEGTRAASADLINLMPTISECAREFAIEEHYKSFYPVGLPDSIKDKLAERFYIANYEKGKKAEKDGKWVDYAQKDAIEKEDYIKAVEQRVVDLAPKWEEEVKANRLKTKVNS